MENVQEWMEGQSNESKYLLRESIRKLNAGNSLNEGNEMNRN